MPILLNPKKWFKSRKTQPQTTSKINTATPTVEIYNDEETLKTRIDDLKNARLDNADEVLALADKYLSGWRPNEFGDR